MNCKKAESFIMNYMDNTLSSDDAEELNKHLKTCDSCKESFTVYEMMLDTLENTELTTAPNDFEEKLMIKISSITPVYLTQNPISIEGINSLIWGIFTIFFGAGIMLNIYSEPIMNYISQNQYVADFYTVITPIGNLMSEYINSSFAYIESITISMGGVISYLKIACGILAIILCLIQLRIKRNKVDV